MRESIDDLLNTIKPRPPLSTEEEQELARKIQQGDRQARDALVLSNIGLLLQHVNRYCTKGISKRDLFQVGCEALITGAETFEPRGFRFSTYAVRIIKQRMHDALRRYETVPRSARGQTAYYKIRQAQSNGELSTEELRKAGMTEQELEQGTSITYVELDDEEVHLELISPENVNDATLTTLINTAIQDLPEQQQDILARHYGLKHYTEQEDLNTIAATYHLTREHARRRLRESLIALRRHPFIQEYADLHNIEEDHMTSSLA